MRLIALKGMRSVNGLHFAPAGRRLLAVGGYEVRSLDEARWIDIGEGKETLRVQLNADCYAVTPDLSQMALGDAQPHVDDTEVPPVAVIDPTDPRWHEDDSRWREVGEFNRNSPLLFGLAFAPDGKRLAVSLDFSSDGVMYSPRFVIVPLAGRRKAVEMQDATASISHLLTFSPDGSRIAYGGGSTGVIGAIDSETAEYVGLYTPAGQRCRHLVYSSDGLLAAANGKHVYLTRRTSEVALLTLLHPKQVNAVAFTPDGRRVLTTSTDKLVRIWDAASGQLVTSYDFGVGGTTAVAVAPDGLTAAVGGARGKVVLFDLDG